MAFVTPVVEHWLEREIAQWVHSMKDRSDNPTTQCTMRECSYHEATSCSVLFNDALNTFYLQLYGFRHMVENYSD